MLTFYSISKFKVNFIENTVVNYFNNLLGDYSYVWSIVIGINILLISDIFIQKYKTEIKFGLIMSILAIPFSNIIYIWKREKYRQSVKKTTPPQL